MRNRLRTLKSFISYKFRWYFSGLVLMIPKYGTQLARRSWLTEVGLSGHVSMIDDAMAEQNQLLKLNRFEKWLMRPRIESQKRVNWDRFREAMIEVIGEDPDADPYASYTDEDRDYEDQLMNQLGRDLLSRFETAQSSQN